MVPAAGAVAVGRRPLWHYQRRDGRLALVPQEHPARVRIARYGLWFAHRGGAELRVYAEEESAAGAFPPESACWPTAEERSAAAGAEAVGP